uniref:Uncharacterized protein n=1 Tax=Toxoplasma gondii COUG TaxID=1074873 RepID=A0A2G8Y2K2_TOXGO|nr:hypothetical protein TGCOUG_320660 [Toxoplasma gondii COUG]
MTLGRWTSGLLPTLSNCRRVWVRSQILALLSVLGGRLRPESRTLSAIKRHDPKTAKFTNNKLLAGKSAYVCFFADSESEQENIRGTLTRIKETPLRKSENREQRYTRRRNGEDDEATDRNGRKNEGEENQD